MSHRRSMAPAIIAGLMAVAAPQVVHSDGTEFLGPPSIPVAAGSDVIAAGVGMVDVQPGVIDIDIPAGVTVEQIILYWEGQAASEFEHGATDDILLNGAGITGDRIGGPTAITSTFWTSTYRKDITGLVALAAGPNAIEISGLDFGQRDNGAGVLVIVDDGVNTTGIDLSDGNDYAFTECECPGDDQFDVTEPQTYTFDAADEDRTAKLNMFFSSVALEDPTGLFGRPSIISIRIDGVLVEELIDMLANSDGPEWDTLVHEVTIPAFATSLTVQGHSIDSGVGPFAGHLPASFVWVAGNFTLLPGDEPDPPEDCCVDGAKPEILTMLYTGDDCSASSHSQNPDKVSCDGDPMFEPMVRIRASDKENPNDGKAKVWFDGEVALGDPFDIDAGNAGEDHLKAMTFLHIYDLADNLLQEVEFHTSCSQPLNAGDQFGAAHLVGCSESPPVEGDCCDNGDKPAVLTMQYTGEDCSASSHSQNPDKVSCDGDPMLEALVRIRASDKENPNDGKAKVWFDGEVALNDTFDVDSGNAGEDHLKAKTFLHIYDLDDNLLQVVEFHTSCSQPLIEGDQFGAGLLIGCSNETEPIEGDCCDNGDKPAVLTMLYTGEDCSASSHSQNADKVSCAGDPMFDALVHIRASDKENPNDGKAKVWFDGDVALNDTFDVDSANGGEAQLKAKTFLHISDLAGNLLQVVEFHTSCSQPLAEGDQFGAAQLITCSTETQAVEGAFCFDGAKPSVLLMEYTGEDCSASSNSQNADKVTCEGDPALAPVVHIRASDKQNPSDGTAKVWFGAMVVLGVPFEIDATNAGENKLKAVTWVHISDLDGNLLQLLEFHTSCSQPLNQDNQFGSLLLLDFIPE